MADKQPTLTFIGGTGDLGSGLAWRLAKAGYPVIIDSRTAEKAEMSQRGDLKAKGMDNPSAAAAGDIVFMTVPFASHAATLASIRDRVQEKYLSTRPCP